MYKCFRNVTTWALLLRTVAKFFWKTTTGFTESKPPKFLLMECNISNQVGGLPDLSTKLYTIFTRLKQKIKLASFDDCIKKLIKYR